MAFGSSAKDFLELSHDRRESADLVLEELTAVSVLEPLRRRCSLGDLYADQLAHESRSAAP